MSSRRRFLQMLVALPFSRPFLRAEEKAAPMFVGIDPASPDGDFSVVAIRDNCGNCRYSMLWKAEEFSSALDRLQDQLICCSPNTSFLEIVPSGYCNQFERKGGREA